MCGNQRFKEFTNNRRHDFPNIGHCYRATDAESRPRVLFCVVLDISPRLGMDFLQTRSLTVIRDRAACAYAPA